MACDADTLLADGACYGCLSQGQAAIVELALLAVIVRALDPGADLSPDALVASGTAQFGGLNEGQMEIAEIQLLCDISEAL